MRAQALVARNLRRLRVERGLSQENLAADAGIDRTYVSRLERGLENPTIAILEQLADALGAPIVELLAVPAPGEPPPKPLRGGRRPKRYVATLPGRFKREPPWNLSIRKRSGRFRHGSKPSWASTCIRTRKNSLRKSVRATDGSRSCSWKR